MNPDVALTRATFPRQALGLEREVFAAKVALIKQPIHVVNIAAEISSRLFHGEKWVRVRRQPITFYMISICLSWPACG